MRLTGSVSRVLRRFVTVVSSLSLMVGLMVGFQATVAQAASEQWVDLLSRPVGPSPMVIDSNGDMFVNRSNGNNVFQWNISKVSPDGAKVDTWNSALLTSPTAGVAPRAMNIGPVGASNEDIIYVAQGTYQAQGTNKAGMSRILSDGTVDNSWVPTWDSSGSTITMSIAPSGNLYVLESGDADTLPPVVRQITPAGTRTTWLTLPNVQNTATRILISGNFMFIFRNGFQGSNSYWAKYNLTTKALVTTQNVSPGTGNPAVDGSGNLYYTSSTNLIKLASDNSVTSTPLGFTPNTSSGMSLASDGNFYLSAPGTVGTQTSLMRVDLSGANPVVDRIGGIVNATGEMYTDSINILSNGNVVVPWFNSTSRAGGLLKVTPMSVDSVDPTSGVSIGGQSITIHGEGFDDAATVSIGGAACTGVSVNEDRTELTCTTSAAVGGLGAKDVVVTNVGGVTDTIPGAFTYEPTPPVFGSVNPDSGPVGTQLTISGSQFGAGVTVSVGGTACGSVNRVSATTITCNVPNGLSPGSKNITITNTDTGTITQNNAFTVISSPTIGSVAPVRGSVVGGTDITITGTQFAAGATVTIGGQPCASVSVVSNTSITCTTPAGAALGDVDVVVTNTDGGTVTDTDGFTYVSAPTIGSVSPSTAPGYGGTTITITGTNFQNDPGTTVTVGGQPCTDATVVSPTEITCKSPAFGSGDLGAKDVVVTNADTGSVTANDAFSAVVSTPSVDDDSITPNFGSKDGGTTITINGDQFGPGATVTVGGQPCSNLSVNPEGTQITCDTPAGSTGTADVVITNTDGGTTTVGGGFTYTSAPAVTGISPAGGPATGGTQITISGADFIAGATVTIGGVACALPIVNVGDQTITCTTPAGVPGDPEVIVTNPDQGTVTVNNEFTYVSVPTIDTDGISPTAGNNTGGTTLTINGTGFLPGAQVYVGDADVPANLCTSIQINGDGTQITCTTPAGSNGGTDVTVVNPDAEFGLGVATVDGAFTFVTPPTIDGGGISPTSGPASGTAITINGTGFIDSPDTKVLIGDVECTDITVVSATQITCTTPELPFGEYDITVNNADGGTATVADGFKAVSEPAVSGISPTAGNNTGGTTITINGTNFESDATVTVGGQPCANPVVNGDGTQITCTTPAGSNGAADIVVTNGDGGTVTDSGAFTFVTPPTIDGGGISPDDGPASGTAITINGTGFIDSPNTKVLLGDVECTNIVVVSATQITCTTPDLDPGSYDITVNNADGGMVTVADAFTALSEPTIAGVSPDKIPHTGGVVVTVTGSDFTAGATVTIGGAACTSVTVVSDTEITCTAPAGTQGQSADVVVTNSDGGTVTAASDVEFVSAPDVDTVGPISGGSSGGTPITITGSEFVAGATVTVGGQPCTNVQVVSDTEITCTTPAGSPGAQSVVVTNPDGGAFTANGGFTYLSEPTISGISPTGGNNTGGTHIVITGTQFVDSPSPAVTIGGNACADVSVVSPTQITCTTPAGTNGAANVVVTNDDGGSFTANGAFTYVDPPTVSGISPDNGSGAGGTVITIDGTDFAPGATVTVGGVPCTPVTLFGATQLTCVTGAHGTGVADVVVTNSNGGSVTEAGGFTYNQSTPTVSGISPDGGNNTGGSKITITGTDFGSGVTVKIGDEECTDVQVTEGGTKITCTTPAQVNGTYDVTVTNVDDGEVIFADAFTYVTPPTVSGVSPKTGSTAGGETVTINGSNFAAGVAVTIGGKPCAPVTVVSATKITCKAPAGTVGKADLVITNSDHGTVTIQNAFTYSKPTSNTVKPNQKPTKLKVQGKPTASKFKVSWSKPKDTSATRPVTKYILTVQLKGRSKVVILRNLPRNKTSYTLTRKQLTRALGLRTRGEITGTLTFLVKVRAVNEKGKGPIATSTFKMRVK